MTKPVKEIHVSEAEYPFETIVDKVLRGDKKREVRPSRVTQEEDLTVYYFPWVMFHNPKYQIPKDELTLFYNFIDGGSRAYASDGPIPAMRAAMEAQDVITAVREIAADRDHPFNKKAKRAVEKGYAQIEDHEVVRGTIGLMLGQWMPDDWQKKRFTEDIDLYWEKIDDDLLVHVLTKLEWKTKDRTPGGWSIWTKYVPEVPDVPLELCNDLTLGKDFVGSEAALEGIGLKSIVKKKILRGHDVDISDIINVALKGHLNIDEDDEKHPWRAVIETLWRGGREDVTHLVSICQHAFSIVQHYRNTARATMDHVGEFFNTKLFTDEDIKVIYSQQTPVLEHGGLYYWEPFKKGNATNVVEMRMELYNFFYREGENRRWYGSTLNTFAHAINWALNRHFRPRGIKFDIHSNYT